MSSSALTVRFRYSREQMIYLKDISATIIFPAPNIPPKVTRGGNRKKSQSIDNEGPKPPSESHEELTPSEVDRGAHPWHRSTKQLNSDVTATHSNHDSGQTDVSNAPLRPADSRRGHGDWSRGCAGWRQRSYSGSEHSVIANTRYPQHSHTGRGRGGGDDFGIRGRGRGRAARYNYANRGRGGHQSHHAYRPSSCADSSSPFDVTDDFWLDEDWESVDQDHHNNSYNQYTAKSRERLNSKTFVDPVSQLCVTAESMPSSRENHNQAKAAEMRTVAQGVSKLRVHSKSCSIEPPPGFDMPPPSFRNTNQSTKTADGSSTPPAPKLDPITSSNWYYIDSKNKIQGPFIHQQMASWLTAGYLPLNIQIRRACDDCFVSLADHMNLAGRIPFWNGYSHPPITRLNLPTSFKTDMVKPDLNWPNQSPPPPPPTSSSATVCTAPPLTAIVNTAAAAAVLFATAAGLASQANKNSTIPAAISPTPPGQPVTPITTNNVHPMDDFVGQHSPVKEAILPQAHQETSLPLNTQTFADQQQAKLEADRRQWASKLAAINSTAVTLLAATPTLSPSAAVESTKVVELSSQLWPEPVSTSVQAHCLDPDLYQAGDVVVRREEEGLSSASLHHIDEIGQLKSDAVHVPSTDNSLTRPHAEDDEALTPCMNAAVKKGKKKNKKNKKKLTPEQERQLAWETEIERRKTVAQERRQAEEAEERRIAAEEAAARASEQLELIKEQKRFAKEQRKLEVQRSKENTQLEKLRLPQSARWGTDTVVSSVRDSVGPSVSSTIAATTCVNQPVSLVAIQAAQAVQEAEHKRQASMAQHIASSIANTKQQRPQAWSAKDNLPTKQDNVHLKSNAPKLVSSIAAVSNEKASHKTESNKSGSTSKGAKPVALVSPGKSNSTTGNIPSIWDLPTDGKTDHPKSNKNAKKNKKKNSQKSEAALFAAKEQLAHWCESQLSSLPLSGVDLPTLVDLLCELEAPDQVAEFIESSLGRSTQIMKFSKAFLEKRASILHPVH